VAVIGVSTDKPEAQAKFKAKYNLPFTLLADHDQKVVKAFGVPTTMGFAKRSAFLIKDGKIVWADYSASTKPAGGRCAAGGPCRSVTQSGN
jgi:peroxiredoxin Q/BCP